MAFANAPLTNDLTRNKYFPIRFLGLSDSTLNSLINSGVHTLNDLISAREKGYENIESFSENFIAEIEREVFENERGKDMLIEASTPLISVEEHGIPNLVKFIGPLVKSLMKVQKKERYYDILSLRYGLDNENIYTLQEIGDYYGITRERVRQLENQAKSNVQKNIVCCLSKQKWLLPEIFTDEFISFGSDLLNLGDLLTEKEIINFTQCRYSYQMSNCDLGSMRLLLSLIGFELLPKTTNLTISQISIEPSWMLPGKINKNRLLSTINTIYKLLLAEIKPISKFEVIVKLNRSLKIKTEPEYIDHALRICPDIEKVENEHFQLRFIALHSIGDKAYRVLCQANKTLHVRDILREINRLQTQEGLQANNKTRTLQQQLVADARFVPIGRSGEWSLAEWKNITNETILELMQEYFHIKQSSATAREVFDYVHEKRKSVNKIGSIRTYLIDQKKLFVRVGNGKYSLAAWGEKSINPTLHKFSDNLEFNEQLEPVFKSLFSGENIDKLPLWLTVKKVSQLTGLSPQTIRKRIPNLAFLKVEKLATDPRRKVLIYVHNRGNSLTALVKGPPPKKTFKRDLIQSEITSFLLKEPGNSAPLNKISSHVIKKTGCLRPTFYRYLGEMENIRKDHERSVVMCRLVNPRQVESNLSFTQIETIIDPELKENLQRAVSNLNIENVDLGLFQLGKIFEMELRSFLTLARLKNSFPVSSNDLDKLVDMINCIDKNGIVKEKHHLTLLREHRNERAHGEIPDILGRKKLMQNAPFLADMYITYIKLFNEKRHNL